MTTFDTFRSASRPAPATNIFSTLLGQLISWNDRRATEKMLNSLTDRELYDIGLERGQISTWSNGRR